MTNIQWQLCQPEQAAKLKALGCLQIGTWFYENGNANPYQWLPTITPIDLVRSIAYTSAELGTMLPNEFLTKRSKTQPIAGNESHYIWECFCYRSFHLGTSIEVTGSSEAVARAATLIYMLESDVIELKEVNGRLEAAFA